MKLLLGYKLGYKIYRILWNTFGSTKEIKLLKTDGYEKRRQD